MKIDYEANFKGYISIPRCIQLLIPQEKLTLSELGAYICFVMQADYDTRHKNYGIILREDQEIAKKLNLSPSTLYRQKKKLIKRGLLIDENNNIKLPNFPAFTISFLRTIANDPPEYQTNIFKFDNPKLKKELLNAEMQKDQVQNNTQSFNDSSKVNLCLSEEYEDIVIPDDFPF
ncbi:MAG: Lrp/AsnC family transcriptional regulator [Candidatus Shapirobacteria bacterium]|jgi:hypothetical protein